MATRRDVLKKLSTLPALFGAFLQPGTVTNPKREQRRTGLAILRLINTIQHRYRHQTGRFGQLQIVLQSGVMQGVRNNPTANRQGITGDFLDALNFNGPAILPNWRLHFTLMDNGAGYRILLEDTGRNSVGNLITDESALIRSEGVPAQLVENAPLAPNQPTRFQRVISRIENVSFLTVGIRRECTPCDILCDFGCWASGGCCCCSCDNVCCLDCFDECCYPVYQQGCWNCGTCGCTWVCQGHCL